MPRAKGKAYSNDRQQAETICWDCARAYGGCSWSATLEPVPGWTTRKQGNGEDVVTCPQFVADAKNGGEIRI